MLIRFLHGIASSEGWSHPPGKAVEMDDSKAEAFIRGGIAEAVSVEPEQLKPKAKK